MQTSKWQPSGFIKVSAVAHAGALAALAVPGGAPWSLAALIANHAALTAAGLWPRNRLLGPNILRLDSGRPEIAITIDDGPNPDVTPAVLRILDEHNAKATFFCIASRAQQFPELVKQIIAAGHDIENHSMFHRHNFSMMGMGGLKKELMQAQQTIFALTGRTPQYFRAPAGLRNPFLDPVLHQTGLQLASWTRRGFDTRTSDADLVLQRLLRNLAAGDILLLHDGNAAKGKNETPVILDALPRLIDAIHSKGMCCVTLRQGMRDSQATTQTFSSAS
ncbi:MAG: polysaccharide deacetylase family protein [Burkholderiaceae bacterium]